MRVKALKRLNRKLTVENLWLYVMAILIKEPTYAYDVKKKIRKSFGFNPSTITLYTVIYRLNKEGLIRMRSSEPKVYEVTEAGKKAYVKAVKYLETSVNKLKSVMD